MCELATHELVALTVETNASWLALLAAATCIIHVQAEVSTKQMTGTKTEILYVLHIIYQGIDCIVRETCTYIGASGVNSSCLTCHTQQMITLII